jgi:hypothetical protein
MAEKHYAFIKDGVVENTLVFADENEQLAYQVCIEYDYDQAVWLDDAPTPTRWSSYDGKKFTPPTDEYLISIGIYELDTKTVKTDTVK